MKVSVAGESLQLLPERALFWPRMGTLFLADLHVGKVETFQRHGVALPTAQARADVTRLARLMTTTAARQVFVLGDLIHGRHALRTNWLAELVLAHPRVIFHLVAGNHDRHVDALPPDWRFEVHDAGLRAGPFVLAHEPEPSPDGYVLAGHLHPVVRLDGAADSLRLPCFHFTERVGTLPAFSEFTGGSRVDPAVGRSFVIADGEVLAL